MTSTESLIAPCVFFSCCYFGILALRYFNVITISWFYLLIPVYVVIAVVLICVYYLCVWANNYR